MGRKKKCRTIDLNMRAICSCFWPLPENPTDKLDDNCIILEADELQVLQLKDGEWLTMVAWSKRMGISKSVFGDTYKKARAKLVDMVLHAKTLMIKCPYENNGGTFMLKH